MAESAGIEFTAGGARYTIKMEDLTASDSLAFRRAVGIPLAAAFQQGNLDLDVIAALVYVVRRKGDPTVTFEQVAETITYSNVDFGSTDDPVAPEVAEDSPLA